jgi:hypothetical protein
MRLQRTYSDSAIPTSEENMRRRPTAICMPGVRCLTGLRWPRLPASLLSAFSRTARVLNTTTPGYAPSATEA